MAFFSRYGSRNIFLNNDDNYRKVFFKDRDIKETLQYETAVLDYPTNEEINQFQNITHAWTATDKLYNLSNDYYGTPGMWWVIAWYNKKPTEAHFNVGDVIYIPMPLEKVLEYF